jgi:DNA-binding MarR family transcriptional regulator
MPRRLQAEIHQTKPFRSLEDEAYLNVLRTADALLRKETELLKEYGLSPTQYNALRILRGAGSEGVTCGEVSDRMLTKDPDVTRLLDRLERRGLLRRTRSDQDRRVVRTQITTEGLEVLAKLDDPSDRWTRGQLGHMSETELQDFIRLLERAREGING